jgi:hypothetical protein
MVGHVRTLADEVTYIACEIGAQESLARRREWVAPAGCARYISYLTSDVDADVHALRRATRKTFQVYLRPVLLLITHV